MSGARSVLKWEVAVDDDYHFIGAGPAVLVGCQLDPRTVQVWTDEPDADNVAAYRAARVYGTGHPVPDDAIHVGSVLAGQRLVWHVFTTPPADDTTGPS